MIESLANVMLHLDANDKVQCQKNPCMKCYLSYISPVIQTFPSEHCDCAKSFNVPSNPVSSPFLA
jgi:hypothetical protein